MSTRKQIEKQRLLTRCAGSDTLRVVALLQQTMDTTDRELDC